MRSPADEPDFYAVLGVPADAGATEITRAFRRKAFVAHPDHGGDADAIRDLYLARETLLDPDRRAGYDRRRSRRRTTPTTPTTPTTKDRPPAPGRTAADPFQRAADPFQRAADPFQRAADPFQRAADPFQWAAGAGPSSDDQDRFHRTAGVWPDPDPSRAYDPGYSWLRGDRFGWWKPATGPRSKWRRGGG